MGQSGGGVPHPLLSIVLVVGDGYSASYRSGTSGLLWFGLADCGMEREARERKQRWYEMV